MYKEAPPHPTILPKINFWTFPNRTSDKLRKRGDPKEIAFRRLLQGLHHPPPPPGEGHTYSQVLITLNHSVWLYEGTPQAFGFCQDGLVTKSNICDTCPATTPTPTWPSGTRPCHLSLLKTSLSYALNFLTPNRNSEEGDEVTQSNCPNSMNMS